MVIPMMLSAAVHSREAPNLTPTNAEIKPNISFDSASIICEMASGLIERKGERELHKQLLQYLKDHNYAKASNKELEFHALELHMDRIFDNEHWLGFVEFNQQYRPEILTATRLILIMPECCKKAGLITRTRYEENQENNFCPYCGRWTKISLIKAEIDSN